MSRVPGPDMIGRLSELWAWQVVTDIGRGDLLLGLTAASECPVGPHISGILCTSCGSAKSDVSPHIQHILNVSLSSLPRQHPVPAQLPVFTLCIQRFTRAVPVYSKLLLQ